jgi:hypothetical protein
VEDFVRDFVIQVGGPLPVIGGSLIVAALFGWGAIAFREESAVAIVSGLVAAGALLFALFLIRRLNRPAKISLRTIAQNIRAATVS